MAKTEHSRVSRQDWKLYITHASGKGGMDGWMDGQALHMQGPELAEIGSLAPTTGREMLKSQFFPEVKELIMFMRHINTKCERGKLLSGECLE